MLSVTHFFFWTTFFSCIEKRQHVILWSILRVVCWGAFLRHHYNANIINLRSIKIDIRSIKSISINSISINSISINSIGTFSARNATDKPRAFHVCQPFAASVQATVENKEIVEVWPPIFFSCRRRKPMDSKKQSLKHSIESLLRLLENQDAPEAKKDSDKVVLESCADAEMFACDEETCEVPESAILPSTFAMHEGKVVQCLPLDYLGVIKAKGEKRSILDRSTDVLRKLHEVAIPQMQKMLSHRQRMTCSAYDTGRNDENDRAMCNAAVDLGGNRRCFWDPIADQRCQRSVKFLADEMERLRVHMDKLAKAVQEGDFRDFVTGLVEKHKNEWRTTFLRWQRIKVEFQERAFWFEKSLGKQEMCRVHNRDRNTCEASGVCEFTHENVCRVTPEEQRNGPVWVADQGGGTVPVVADEFPHYLAGYRSIFREYRIEDEYDVGQTMERMRGGALALSLKLRRERLWKAEVEDGAKNHKELEQQKQQLELMGPLDYNADKDDIEDVKKGLERAQGDQSIHSLQAFRNMMVTTNEKINEVMEGRRIVNAWDKKSTAPTTAAPTAAPGLKTPAEQRTARIFLEREIRMKTNLMEQKQNEQVEVQSQLEQAEQVFNESCGALQGGGDDPDCNELEKEVQRLKEKKKELSDFIETIQRQRQESAKAIVKSKEEQQQEEEAYVAKYGKPPQVPVEEFKAASPWHGTLVEWEQEAKMLYRPVRLDTDIVESELKYHACNVVLEFFAMYVEIVTLLKTNRQNKALLVALDMLELQGKLGTLSDTDELMRNEFGSNRPIWLQYWDRESLAMLPPFYLDKNKAYQLNEQGAWVTHAFDSSEWDAAKKINERYNTDQDGRFSWLFKKAPPTLAERNRLNKVLDSANVGFPTEFQGNVAVEGPLFDFRQQYTLAATTQPDGKLVALQPALMATHLSDTKSSQVWKGVVQDFTETKTKVNGNSRRLVLVQLTARKGQNEEWSTVDNKDPIVVDMGSIQENYSSETWPPVPGDEVRILTSVYVERFVTPVRTQFPEELLPWVSVQNKHPEKRTNDWFAAIGPYINPNVSLYDNKQQLDAAFCEQLRSDQVWFKLYTSEDENDHQQLLQLANRPQPKEFKQVGGWKPNSLWMHTLHGPEASVKNVYAHHLKPVSSAMGSMGWMAQYFTNTVPFEETEFPQGTLVRRKNSRDVYMIDSGMDIKASDMYDQLHPENQPLHGTRRESMEYNGTWYTNVPMYTCVSFTRKFQICTATSVEGSNVTFQCKDGKSVTRNVGNRKIQQGDEKTMPFYEKTGQPTLSHLELEEVPTFSNGDTVLYTTRFQEELRQAHGKIKSVFTALSMVTIEGKNKLFVGFEDLQKTNDTFAFNLGNTVAIQYPIEEVVLGQNVEHHPRLQGFGGFDNNDYLTRFHVINVHLGRTYTIQQDGNEPMTILEDNLVFFDSLLRASTNNPFYRPKFHVKNRLFVTSKEALPPNTSTTKDLVLEQWKETREVEVISVYPIDTLKDDEAKDVTFCGYKVKPLNANVKMLPFNVTEEALTRDEPTQLATHDVVEVTSADDKPLSWLTTWGTSGLYTETVQVGEWTKTVQGRRPFPTCHDDDKTQQEVTDSRAYFAAIEKLSNEYRDLKTAQENVKKNIQENEDMFGDLEDVSVVQRKPFLVGGETRTLEAIQDEAKNLPTPRLEIKNCISIPEYMLPDNNILFSVHQWGERTFRAPLKVYNDKTYTVMQEKENVSDKYRDLMMPTWNLFYDTSWFSWDTERTVFPRLSADKPEWLQAGEMSNAKTRLIGRIEEIEPDRARVRFQSFPKGKWEDRSSCIIVSCWVKKDYLNRIDYAKEYYDSRRYFAWNDTSDVPSFAVAGWTKQQSETLVLDGDETIASPHTDSRVPWMLKTMAFQRPWTEQVRMVETVLKGDDQRWKDSFLKAVLQFQQKKEVDDLTWGKTAEEALHVWMEMAKEVKRLVREKETNELFMKDGVPLDLHLVPLEWFYERAYPMRKIFYQLKKK